jgi:hypothetical protein
LEKYAQTIAQDVEVSRSAKILIAHGYLLKKTQALRGIVYGRIVQNIIVLLLNVMTSV